MLDTLQLRTWTRQLLPAIAAFCLPQQPRRDSMACSSEFTQTGCLAVSVRFGDWHWRRKHAITQHKNANGGGCCVVRTPAWFLPSGDWSKSEAPAHQARRMLSVGCRDDHWVGAMKFQQGSCSFDKSGLEMAHLAPFVSRMLQFWSWGGDLTWTRLRLHKCQVGQWERIDGSGLILHSFTASSTISQFASTLCCTSIVALTNFI